MDLFNDNLHENDDLRMICEGSAPFNDNVFHELTSYLEVPNQCHSAAYGLPDFDDSMFALDTTSAINGGLTDSAGQSPGEDFPGGDFPGPEGSIVVGDNANRDILLQVLARLVALEGKIDKLQESHADGVEKLRREVAGLREAIGPQVLLEVQSKG